MRVLITGLMGSGKTTQARRVADKLGLCFLTTGDVLREIASEDSARGKLIKDQLSKGEMVDDTLVAEIIKDRLSKDDAKDGFVSDSYPRHLGQLEYFDPKLEKIFYLNIDPELAKERLLKRGRPDDTKELIDLRHKTQGEKINQLVDFYKNKIDVYEIDANKSEDEICDEILAHLNGT